MFDPLRLPRRLVTATLAGATLAAGLACAAPAMAAPLPPAGAAVPAVAAELGGATQVQYWGHPGWGRPGWGPRSYGPPRYGWHRRYAWGGPACSVRYVRVWDDWRGFYVTRPVRRCW